MKKNDFEAVVIMIMGILYSIIGSESIRYCFNNASIVTQANWIAAIGVTWLGIFLVILEIIHFIWK